MKRKIYTFVSIAILASGCTKEKMVSVTHLQITQDTGRKENYIEITYSSSADEEDEHLKSQGLSMLYAVSTLCVDKNKKLQGLGGIHFKDVVGHEDKSPVPLQNGEYLYSIFIPVNSEQFRYRPSLTEQSGYTTYDLATAPQDICTQIRQEWRAPAYRSGWMVTPKEAISQALVLPPDAERSAAYQQELTFDRWSKPITR